MRRALKCFEDREAMGRAVAAAFVEAAQAVESFTVALAGGRTVEPLYRCLAELQGEVPWERVHVFWSDERYVSPTDPDSNVRMARELLRQALHRSRFGESREAFNEQMAVREQPEDQALDDVLLADDRAAHALLELFDLLPCRHRQIVSPPLNAQPRHYVSRRRNPV